MIPFFIHPWYPWCEVFFENPGEDYFWCPTASSWDFCSPQATSILQDISKVNPQACEGKMHGILKLFQDGHICSGICDKMGGSEHFCEVEKSEGFMSSWWDYCSPKEWEIYVFSVRIIIPDYCSPKVDKVPWKMDFCGSGLKILISQIHWKCAFY